MKKNLSLKIAKALFRFAEKPGKPGKEELGKKIFTELKALVAISDDEGFKKTLLHLSSVDGEKLVKLLDEVFEKKLETSVRNILILLIKSRATEQLPELYEAYKKLYFRREHIADVTIISARELNESEKKSILEKLESKKHTAMHENFLVNAELIGGVQIYKNNFLTDLSVKTYLEKLKHHLTSHEYAI